MRSPYSLISLAAALLAAGSAHAQGMTVALDHAERLNIRGAAANVVVGNPGVADVTVVDSHTLYVMGKSYGSTGLNVTDALGRTLYAGDVTVIRPASSVSIYRGVSRSEFACAPSCSETHGASAAASSAADSDSSGSATPTPVPAPAQK
jgi:Flp pilus assembly secretin CpaC